MKKIVVVCLIIVGLINFMPVFGMLSAQSLESAYGVAIIGNDLTILMRHRALLFGILGGFVLYSVLNTKHQNVAMVMVGFSMIGFVILAVFSSGFNASIYKVLVIDIIGIAFLLAAFFAKYLVNNKSN